MIQKASAPWLASAFVIILITCFGLLVRTGFTEESQGSSVCYQPLAAACNGKPCPTYAQALAEVKEFGQKGGLHRLRWRLWHPNVHKHW